MQGTVSSELRRFLDAVDDNPDMGRLVRAWVHSGCRGEITVSHGGRKYTLRRKDARRVTVLCHRESVSRKLTQNRGQGKI